MKKGFTLIELLAVIVILAIIALIATPIVLNIINDSKESAVLRSAEFYLDGVDQAILTATLNNKTVKDGPYYILENGNICLEEYEEETKICKDNDSNPDNNELIIEIKGEKPKEGTIIIDSGEVSNIELTISDKEIWLDPFTEEIKHKLAPGLYDENDKILMSWDELNEYTKEYTYIEGDYNTFDGTIIGETVTGYTIRDIIEGIESEVGSAYKLVIAENITKISNAAFEDCSLTTIIIPDSVETIGELAFMGCDNLTNILIGKGVEMIGNEAFAWCPKLTNIKVDFNNLYYDSRNNSNAIIETATNKLITGGNSTIIPEGVEIIDNYAFSSLESLTTITIPNSVTDIYSNAFDGCPNLTSVKILNSTTIINEGAFSGCGNLDIYYKGDDSLNPWGAESVTIK